MSTIFSEQLAEYAQSFAEDVATDTGDWIVKGFIDTKKNVYTISVDTKVVSKIMELLIYPKFVSFAERYNFQIILSDFQNHYPDLTFVDKNNNKYAVDIKSSYRIDSNTVNGMTLGAFTGYFRDRSSAKNVRFPYSSYASHLVFGLIYSRVEKNIDERKKYSLDQLFDIQSVINDFKFFVQEKYRIASDCPGSGNTKNIGSVTNISDLIDGNGPFSKLGEKVFDDYWMNYLTRDMAKLVEMNRPPYSNINEYIRYKNLKTG